MGTTVDKLQKLLQSKQTLVNIVNEKVGTNYTINSKLSDVINSVNNISGGSGSSYPEYDREFEGNGELVVPGFNIQLYYSTVLSTNTVYTKLKIGSKPTSESDYDFYNTIHNLQEEPTFISTINDTEKVYIWGAYCIINQMTDTEPIFLEDEGYTTYNNAYELDITEDCTLTLVTYIKPTSGGGGSDD
jgi:hypothetical protein